MKRSFAIGLTFVICLFGLAWSGRLLWIKRSLAHCCNQEYEPPPPGMVLVPAGYFLMGSDDPKAESDEMPLRKVFVSAFYIDKYEVTNRRYREFKQDHQYPEGEDDFPVTFVFKHEAEDYGRFAGKRLPRSAEWEKAARGADGRTYPWGNEFKADYCNVQNRTGPLPARAESCKLRAGEARGKLRVGSFPQGASPYGCLDMSGNVWEWVSDLWVDKVPFGSQKGAGPRGIIRGGAYHYSAFQARASYQGFEGTNATCHDVGFRCAMNAITRKK